MTQMTIRNFPSAVELKIRELARERGWSLNRAVIHLLRQATGVEDGACGRGVGSALDEFVGSWSEEEAQAVDRRVGGAFENVDPDVWR